MRNNKYFKGSIVVLLFALLLTACGNDITSKALFSAKKMAMDDMELTLPPADYLFDIHSCYEINNIDEKHDYSLVLSELNNGECIEIWRTKLAKPDEFKTGESRIAFNFTKDQFVVKEVKTLKSDNQSAILESQDLDEGVRAILNMKKSDRILSDGAIDRGEFIENALLFAVISVYDNENFDIENYSKFKGKAVVVSVVKE